MAEVNFSDAVKKYGSTAAAFQALGYTKNDNGSWTKSGTTNAVTNATSTGGSSSGTKTSTSASAQASTATTRAVNENGYDPNLDYSAAIEAAKDRGEDTTQLEAERAAKIKYQYGGVEPNMYGSNQTYTQLSGPASSGNTGAQSAINNAVQFNANNGSQYMGDNAIYKAAYEAAARGDWDKAAALTNQLATSKTLNDGTQLSDLSETNRYLGQLQKLFGYNANDYYQQKYDAVYGAGAWDGGTGTGASANVGNAYNPGSLGDYLDQWLQNAQQQQINKIDYGTNQAVLDLIRQEQDAQGQYQEQRNQIAIDEAKAKDNQALYAEARGDKGGIGQAQYDAIMNTAAQNRLQVNQAQTKLATDTARQIADLRAQGEYEKADALLQLSQQYLSQLINLEQWSMEFGLSVAQFNASLQQWAAEYEMAVADITGNFRGTPTLQYQQYQDELALTQQNQMASAGETLLSAGIMPSASQLAAMGITQEQAQSYITAAQLAAAQKAKSGGSGNGGGVGSGTGSDSGSSVWDSVVDWVAKNGFDSAEDYIKDKYKSLGYSSQSAALAGWNNYLRENATLDMVDEDRLTNKYTSKAVKVENPSTGGTTITSWTSVQNMIDQGMIRLKYNGDGTFTLVYTS